MTGTRKKILNIAEAVVIAVLILFMIIMIRQNSSGYVPFAAINERLRTMPGISRLQQKDDSSVYTFFGLVPTEYIYYRSDDIMDVSELLIAYARDEDEMDLISEAAQSRLAEQIENFTGYGTDQLEKLEHAILIRKGNYYFYGAGDEADEWLSGFLKLIG